MEEQIVQIGWGIKQIITYGMMNKIVGYSGFRSYGELEYPTQKQGKELERANQVWSSTVRASDQITPLQNYHNYKSAYKQFHLQNTKPVHYHPEHVPRGAQTTLNFHNTTGTSYDKPDQKRDNLYPLLKTGTEHWRTDYQHTICQPVLINPNTQHPKDPKDSQLYSQFQAGKRSRSAGKTEAQLTEEAAKAQSYKNKAYVNNSITGSTDYRFNYGEKIGSKPTDLLNTSSYKQPLLNNPLKHGTNQLWTQIPGYQGFKPSSLPFDVLESKISRRTDVNRGNAKLNLIENYHVNIPGYAGFRSGFQLNENQLRQSCLSNVRK